MRGRALRRPRPRAAPLVCGRAHLRRRPRECPGPAHRASRLAHPSM